MSTKGRSAPRCGGPGECTKLQCNEVSVSHGLVSRLERLRRALSNPTILGRGVIRESASIFQRSRLLADELEVRFGPRSAHSRRLFSLDIHPSVIADLSEAMPDEGLSIVRWSISSHNFVHRKFRIAPDPVRHINAFTWKELDDNLVDAFQDRYGKFLRKFSGFVVCYPIAFVKLFANLGRPILAVAATRYETPLTQDIKAWSELNDMLLHLSDDGALTLAANNAGDHDYISYYTRLDPQLVPSLCDYIPYSWTGQTDCKVVFSRDIELVSDLIGLPSSTWQSAKSTLGSRFAWKDLVQTSEIFVNPYNISTMFLFELATAGVPVTMPSRRLIHELDRLKRNPLTELSFFQILNMDPTGLGPGDPNNYSSPSFLNWWLDRADFLNQELMPNVRTVDSIDQAVHEPHPFATLSDQQRKVIVLDRNDGIRRQRSSLIREFSSRL